MSRQWQVLIFYGLSGVLILSIISSMLGGLFPLMSDELKIVILNYVLVLSVIVFGVYRFKEVLVDSLKKVSFDKHFFNQVLSGVIGLLVWSLVFGFLRLMVGGGIDDSVNQEAATSLIMSYPLLMSFLSVCLAPFQEELIFRLAMMNLFGNSKYQKLAGWLISSLVFGLLHVIGSGEWIHLIGYSVSGLILGWFYLKTDNIWYSIAIHLVNNLIATLLVF